MPIDWSQHSAEEEKISARDREPLVETQSLRNGLLAVFPAAKKQLRHAEYALFQSQLELFPYLAKYRGRELAQILSENVNGNFSTDQIKSLLALHQHGAILRSDAVLATYYGLISPKQNFFYVQLPDFEGLILFDKGYLTRREARQRTADSVRSSVKEYIERGSPIPPADYYSPKIDRNSVKVEITLKDLMGCTPGYKLS